MTDKVQKIREEVVRLQNELIQEREKGYGSDSDDACILELQNVLTYIDSLQKEPVSKVWHDPDEEPEVERTIIWEDEKMMGKHLFQGQWRPKIDVFGRKERWCYLSDILNL